MMFWSEIKETILKEWADSWSDAVKARILYVYDLHAVDAVYTGLQC